VSGTGLVIRGGLGLTILIAGSASYLHSLKVVQAADGRTLASWFIPALADLVLATASANLLDANKRGEKWPALAKVAVIFGIGVTLAMNVMASWPYLVPEWCVNVWAPAAFILALEQLADYVRRERSHAPSPDTVWTLSDADAELDGEPEPLTTEQALRQLLGTGSIRTVADTLGVPKSRVETWRSRVSAPATAATAPANPLLRPDGTFTDSYEPSMNGSNGDER